MNPTPTTVDGLPTLTINALNVANSIDPVNDYLPLFQNNSTSTLGINRNTLLNLSSQPLGSTDTQTVSSKTLTNSNIITTLDSNFTLQNNTDDTKQALFSLAGNTTGTTRTYTLPNYSATLATLAGAETLTNKTLNSAILNTPTINNATISANTLSGYTTPNNGVIYGMTVTGGTIGSAGIASGSIMNTNISSGGLYTTKGYNPYKFHYYRASSFTTVGGTVVLPMDTVEYDTNSNYDTTTGYFTAPVTGYYIFGGSVQYQGIPSGETCITGLLTPSGELKRFQESDNSPNNNYTQSGSVELYVTSGTQIGLYAWTGVALNIGVGSIITYFWGSYRTAS